MFPNTHRLNETLFLPTKFDSKYRTYIWRKFHKIIPSDKSQTAQSRHRTVALSIKSTVQPC